MRKILRDNGLSLVLFGVFAITLVGQSVTGLRAYNEDQREHGQPETNYSEYLSTGHFIESVFENWESEFLQMAAFVVFTVFLYQRGSAESKDPDGPEEVDRLPSPSEASPDAPWPVRRGGIAAMIYGNSLSLAFILIFLVSAYLHALGGVEQYNAEQLEHGSSQLLTLTDYLGTSRFWFESFQNWQSEFLSIGLMVVLTIFLRQVGSPESKPIDTPHSEMG
jgi:hypothetical protein